MMRHRIQMVHWAIATGTLLVAGGWWAAFAPNTHAATVPSTATTTVQTGSVTRVLPLAGKVDSAAEASVAYSGVPTSVTAIDVAPGQSVSSGAVLATMANGATLTAPLAGTVVSVGLTTGALVPSSASNGATPAVSSGRNPGPQYTQNISTTTTQNGITVADTQNLMVSADVSETNVHLLSVGEPATLVVPGEPGVSYQGTVQSVGHTPSQGGTGVTYPVALTLAAPKGAAAPWLGMSVQAYVTVGTAHGLVAPVTAIQQNASGQFYVTLADGQTRVITLGLVGTDDAIVTKGLSEGTVIRIPASAKPSRTVTVRG